MTCLLQMVEWLCVKYRLYQLRIKKITVLQPLLNCDSFPSVRGEGPSELLALCGSNGSAFAGQTASGSRVN